MDILSERAETYDQCLRKIKDKYGSNISIIRRQTIQMGGVFGLFRKEGVEISFISQTTGQSIPSVVATASGGGSSSGAYRKMDFEEERKKILAAVKPAQDSQLQEVLKEVREIKEQLNTTVSQTSVRMEEHETILKIENLLALNDFSPSYTRTMLDTVRKTFSLEQLDNYLMVQDQVLEWIGEGIRIHEQSDTPRTRTIVLVGPTGVGKTTTIAKLAAFFGVSQLNSVRPLNVRMITIDNYRIAAKQQIEIYGSIMGIPVSCVESVSDLKKTMALYSDDADVVLIDTIGRSPKDYRKIAEMREILDASGSVSDLYLAVSATTKTSDMKEIIQQFETFGYHSVIITKFDETTRVGNIISVLAEKNKAVSWITNGQRVPQDIEKASVVRFLTSLEGFQVNRVRIEEKFPHTELK
ncbi:MAG: flagellar biosynthesis protein FlhF [Spirochaetaceae bacterium]|jgi:flagellar biosynthesis protein FlhF|nr:flagellar biosynthesis protein FlhF [Spirochaetaceae bacterium]